MCASLAANIDDKVECEEDFTVLLALLTPGNNLNLANTITAITIIDFNGIQTWSCTNSSSRMPFFSAAYFEVGVMATVIEDSTLMVCAEMVSGGATLSKEVIVMVSTIEGSGKTESIVQLLLSLSCDN